MRHHESRREFVRTIGTGLGAPLLLGASNKSGSRKPVLGEGAHTYEATHDWGDLPSDIQYGNTHGVCVDSRGHIYIHHTVYATSEKSDTMVVFDHKGKFVKSWGKQFKGGAHGLHIRKEGGQEYLYLCDIRRGLVVKTTLEGEEIFTLAYPTESEPYSRPGPDGKPLKYSPTNLAVAPNGDIYVADGYGSSYVIQYNSQGKYIKTFGGPGKEAGQLSCPHGIIVDERGSEPVLIVADRSNKRLQRFRLDGSHLDFVEGTPAPCHFHIFQNGEMVLPDLFARVTLMDTQNRPIVNLGDDSTSDYMQTRKLTRDHFRPGKFVCPHGACFDHAGNIYVVEWVEVGRVTQLRKV
jgi:DNA-binding beta-propeller fold protein YncE